MAYDRDADEEVGPVFDDDDPEPPPLLETEIHALANLGQNLRFRSHPASDRLDLRLGRMAFAAPDTLPRSLFRGYRYLRTRSTNDVALRNALETKRRRQSRRSWLRPQNLFRDTAWDILIELFIQEREGNQLSMFGLCATADIPLSSAMRLTQKLCDAGILCRERDPKDGRRSFVTIAPRISSRMQAYFSEGPDW